MIFAVHNTFTEETIKARADYSITLQKSQAITKSIKQSKA